MPSINDVAKHAGVSPMTVSRVVNGAGHVSPDTRARVEQAIEELGYLPNVVARSLRSKRTGTIALIVPDITNAFWTTLVRGVEDAAQSRGLLVLLCNTDENLSKQSKYLDVVGRQRVDGVIIAPCDSDPAHLAKLRHLQSPIVVVDRRLKGWDVDTVTGDSVSGARALVQHLLRLGNRRVAMISGPRSTWTAEDRFAGYLIALAEEGIPVDPALVKYGDSRAIVGEGVHRLTYELFDSAMPPTAIFATNNAIAFAVIAALQERGLRVPHDVGLACFDDLPGPSSLIPFLTVVVQPAYHMGVNAAELLLSRLDSPIELKTRHIVLPTRLIIRHSCGSTLKDHAVHVPSAHLPSPQERRGTLVPQVPPEVLLRFGNFPGVPTVPPDSPSVFAHPKTGEERILKALEHRQADRVAHIEPWITSRSLFQYVLERELRIDTADRSNGDATILPEDQVEFAMRLGMDAVVCHVGWRPSIGFSRADTGAVNDCQDRVTGWTDPRDLTPPPPIGASLRRLERYVRAAQGTGMGVIADFTSFFDNAVSVLGGPSALRCSDTDPVMVERLMDILLEHQQDLMQAVCDRFAHDLVLVMVSDDIADGDGLLLPPEMFGGVFTQRMRRLIAPAKEHGKRISMHTRGKIEHVLPLLWNIGFDAVQPLEPEANDLIAIKEAWSGKMGLIGTIGANLLSRGTREEIEETVREHCRRLAPFGGWILASAGVAGREVPPDNFLAMIGAARKYGQYGFVT